MAFIISIIILIFFTYVCVKLTGNGMRRRRIAPSFTFPGNKYIVNPMMAFSIFVLCTGPIYLGHSTALFKYGVYFLMLLYLLFKSKIKVIYTFPVIAYMIFFAWIIIDGNYSPETWFRAFMLHIKYLLPLLTLWLGYSSVQCEDDFYNCCKCVAVCAFWYALLFGGLSAKLTPWFYFSPIGANVLTYAGLADYFTAIFGTTLVMFSLTNKKKWLYLSAWLLLSTVLEAVRTGMGGIVIASSLFFFFKYKVRSLPLIALVGAIFVGIILFVPEVGEKFYGDEAENVTANDIVRGDAMNLDNMHTNGRSEVWQLTQNLFYKPSPLTGSGTGTVTTFMYERAAREHTVVLLHNDYVQIFCDNGDIGFMLLMLFYLAVIITIGANTWLTKKKVLKLSGSLALGSMAGIAFSMCFDNVVSHSMSSMIIPFFFMGVYFRLEKLSKHASVLKQ